MVEGGNGEIVMVPTCARRHLIVILWVNQHSLLVTQMCALSVEVHKKNSSLEDRVSFYLCWERIFNSPTV